METKNILMWFNNHCHKVHFSDDNINISESYLIKNWSDMKQFLNNLYHHCPNSPVIQQRSTASLIHEWRTHNLCWELGIMPDRVKDVDLNLGQSWWVKVLYVIFSPFYLHFK